MRRKTHSFHRQNIHTKKCTGKIIELRTKMSNVHDLLENLMKKDIAQFTATKKIFIKLNILHLIRMAHLAAK